MQGFDSLPGAGSAASALVAGLEAWYQREARDLPWRRCSDPYGIWISEAMLQQTRVEAVRGYWQRFMERFPTVGDLAQAPEEAVLEAWSGLGYYRRARSLQAAAKMIVVEHGGEFPRERAAALALPGVGPYTAGAVLSIAYDLPEALVARNLERVFARLFGLELVTASAPLKTRAWKYAGALMPFAQSPGAWNQALMELGATVCTPRSPRCLLCPLLDSCQAQQSGDPARLPLPKVKRAPTPVEVWMALVEKDGALLAERRPQGGRMAGLWQLPTIERPGSGPERGLFPLRPSGGVELDWQGHLGRFRHAITRYSLDAQLYRASICGSAPLDGASAYRWVLAGELRSMAITGMTKKALVMHGQNP